jgi:hypothetical protein
VGAGLRETYLAPRRYRLGMAAALVFPLLVIADSAGLLRGAAGDLLYYGPALLASLFLLRTFQMVLALRFHIEASRPVFAVALGLCALLLPRTAAALYVGFTDTLGGGHLSNIALKGLAGLDAAAIVGALATGAALVWLCDKLFQASQPSLALRLLGGLGIVTGYCVLGNGLAEAFGHAGLADLTHLASVMGMVLLHLMWALLFFGALRARQPMQTA